MNRIILILSILFLGILLNSCSINNNKIFWVSGIKTECSYGLAKMQCLNVHKGATLDKENWEIFYDEIEGFEFEEGFMKKLEVREEKIDNPPAGGHSVKFIMVRELDKKVDYRAKVAGDWTLNKINNLTIDKSVKHANITINLNQMQIKGVGECNDYTGQITELTSNTIRFGKIVCASKISDFEDIDQDYFALLNAVSTFQIKNDVLIFYNKKGDKILSYVKGIKKEPNRRIHDIWVAIRINKNPIEEMSPRPRMEINLTTMKVMGNDGCNEYVGGIKEVTDTQICFGTMASTKKMCRKMDVVNAFNTAMHQVASYRLEGLNLIFLDAENKEVLAFLKVD